MHMDAADRHSLPACITPGLGIYLISTTLDVNDGILLLPRYLNIYILCLWTSKEEWISGSADIYGCV